MGDKQPLNRLGGRQGDMIQYETPNWAGFSGQLSYNFGKVQLSDTTTADLKTGVVTTTKGEKINAPQFSANIAYNHQYFDIGLGYSKIDNAASDLKGGSLSLKSDATGKQSDESMTAFTVGATGKFAGVKLSAVWEKTTSEGNNNKTGTANAKWDQEQTSWGLGAYYALNDWEFQAAYAVANNVEDFGKEQADTGGKMWDLGVAYKLHKQVKVIATYSKVDNEKNTAFTTSSGFSLGKNTDASIIAIGLRGDF